jgi:hypothetical protein
MKKIVNTLKLVFRRGSLGVIGSPLNRVDDYTTSLMRGDEYGC